MSQARGEAGTRGGQVRSDCWIAFEPRSDGGIELQVKSKVASMYGESIRQQVLAGLAILGIEHGMVEVEDAGALPFVIDARLETAVRRALGTLEAQLLPEKTVTIAPSA